MLVVLDKNFVGRKLPMASRIKIYCRSLIDFMQNIKSRKIKNKNKHKQVEL